MKYFIVIIRIVFSWIVFVLATSINCEAQTQNKNYTYKVIASIENTWGYDIYSNNKLLIHQPNIPSMEGNRGFASKESAKKVAQFIIQKLNQGVMPPTITKGELLKLNVIK